MVKVKYMTKETYKKYLRSKHWINLRIRYWNSHLLKVCYVCGTKNGLQLHHRTYERIKHERLTDLVPVCDSCHIAIHDYYNANKGNGVSLWDAGEIVKNNYKR